ncbi:hypothetical protein Raf01_45070 [Rugosimonospora africana]|uniref:Uncharacterized protein n=1 Tax=Rugosimonospora africana TaxID=556532 RepID=A0A8J3QRU2_9ACTN|nr:hypothetical protein Raf01_45070 [Rugosimonospora africana]
MGGCGFRARLIVFTPTHGPTRPLRVAADEAPAATDLTGWTPVETLTQPDAPNWTAYPPVGCAACHQLTQLGSQSGEGDPTRVAAWR